jgi:hypothetical protein
MGNQPQLKFSGTERTTWSGVTAVVVAEGVSSIAEGSSAQDAIATKLSSTARRWRRDVGRALLRDGALPRVRAE